MLLEEYDAIPAQDVGARAQLVTRWLDECPQDLFAELRAARPVFVTPKAVLVARHRDVVEVLAQERTFSVRFYRRRMDDVVDAAFMLARDGTTVNWRDRGIMQSVLCREDLPRLRLLAGKLADQALDRADGTVEVVSALGRAVPLGICADYFGFPGPDEQTMLRWSRDTQRDMFRNPGFQPDVHERSVQAGREMRAYLTDLVSQRRRALAAAAAAGRDLEDIAPDVVGRLLRLRLPEEVGFDDKALLANIVGLLVGSVETTSHAVVNALQEILRRDGVREAALAAARGAPYQVFDAYVWEALRLNPINQILPRLSETNYAFRVRGGEQVVVPAGSVVLAGTASALVDEEVLDDPLQFDAGRQPKVDLTFGYGHHACLGRLVAEQVVPEVVRRVLLRIGEADGAGPGVGVQAARDARALGGLVVEGKPFPERFVVTLSPAAGARAQVQAVAGEDAADGSDEDTVLGQRSRASDGLLNQVEFALLTKAAPVWAAVEAVPPLRRSVNRYLINRAASRMPARPNPLSTAADYTSWPSLTDRSFSARHLPPVAPEGPPQVEGVTALFDRVDGQERLCRHSTLLFTYFAQWFTDGFLRSDRGDRGGRPDVRRNRSPHEVDLSQLYGATERATRALRGDDGELRYQLIDDEEFPPALCEAGDLRPEFVDLKPVRFAQLSPSQRAGLFALGSDRAHVSSGVTMFNVLFLREHNRVARLLRATYPRWHEDQVFETARNTLTVLLLKLVLEEYVNHITPYRFRLTLDPPALGNPPWYRPNRTAVEFNLLYRWHSLSPGTVCVGGRRRVLADTVADGSPLRALGLQQLFLEASGQSAGRLGLHNTDPALRDVEAASIGAGRELRLPPYNAYRRLCGLPPVRSFAQITGDRRVQQELRDLYGTPDRVEFYVGLFAEDPRPGSPLGPLMGRMVGVDALTQALTNPLLSRRVFNDDAFGCGLGVVRHTASLHQLVRRNSRPSPEPGTVTMSRVGAQPRG